MDAAPSFARASFAPAPVPEHAPLDVELPALAPPELHAGSLGGSSLGARGSSGMALNNSSSFNSILSSPGQQQGQQGQGQQGPGAASGPSLQPSRSRQSYQSSNSAASSFGSRPPRPPGTHSGVDATAAAAAIATAAAQRQQQQQQAAAVAAAAGAPAEGGPADIPLPLLSRRSISSRVGRHSLSGTASEPQARTLDGSLAHTVSANGRPRGAGWAARRALHVLVPGGGSAGDAGDAGAGAGAGTDGGPTSPEQEEVRLGTRNERVAAHVQPRVG